MKNIANNIVARLALVIVAIVVVYEISFGAEHRRFERNFNMAYPLLPEYKANARTNIVIKLNKKWKAIVAMHNDAVRYRILIQSLPDDTPERKAARERYARLCDYLERRSFEETIGPFRDACRSARMIGAESGLICLILE